MICDRPSQEGDRSLLMRELREGRTISGEDGISTQNNKTPISLWFLDFWI